tara:strand:- start:399 stop:560 length:162 start_codon:yes stop_codon:yes gene_type:complete
MYKLYKNSLNEDYIIKSNTDGSITYFAQNPDNTDYLEYLEWAKIDGNTIAEAD